MVVVIEVVAVVLTVAFNAAAALRLSAQLAATVACSLSWHPEAAVAAMHLPGLPK